MRITKQTIAVLRVDGDGVVTWASGIAERWLGPCVGKRCCDVVRAFHGRALHCDLACGAAIARSGEVRQGAGLRVHGEASQLLCAAAAGTIQIAILPTGEAQPFETLTERETEVLRLVARGLTDADIANRLEIGEETVHTHVKHARGKLGAPTRARAVALALATGLL